MTWCLRSPGLMQELKVSLPGSSSKVVKCQCSNGCCSLYRKTNGMRSCLWVPLLWALAWKGQTASIYVLKSLEVRNSSESFQYGKTGRKSIGKIITWTWRYSLCTWTKMCFAMEDMKCWTSSDAAVVLGESGAASGDGCLLWREALIQANAQCQMRNVLLNVFQMFFS